MINSRMAEYVNRNSSTRALAKITNEIVRLKGTDPLLKASLENSKNYNSEYSALTQINNLMYN